MANAYREGKGWSIRAQYKGISIYKGGFSSARKAETYVSPRRTQVRRGFEVASDVVAVRRHGLPAGSANESGRSSGKPAAGDH
jgi:hypothetical protein